MFRIFCVAYMILPFFGLWLEGILSGFWFMLISVAALVVCGVQTAIRADRTPIYEIFARMVLTAHIPFLVFWWVVAQGTLSFWEITWCAFFVAGLLVVVSYVVVMAGMGALGLTSKARATGHHPYWDSLMPLWNPHSVMARSVSQSQQSVPTPRRPARPTPTPVAPFPTIPVKRK